MLQSTGYFKIHCAQKSFIKQNSILTHEKNLCLKGVLNPFNVFENVVFVRVNIVSDCSYRLSLAKQEQLTERTCV